MKREWKPGDLAICGLHNVKVVKAGAPGKWLHPNFAAPQTIADLNVRPLVVIDPEDREQVERLRSTLGMDHYYGTAGLLAASLREFANPKPPKPDEPQGLGAVVEDAGGVRWVRVGELGYAGADDWKYAGTLRSSKNEWVTYADIDAVKVLSEGVTP